MCPTKMQSFFLFITELINAETALSLNILIAFSIVYLVKLINLEMLNVGGRIEEQREEKEHVPQLLKEV